MPFKEKLIYSSLLLPCFLLVLLVPAVLASIVYKEGKIYHLTWDYFYFSVLFVTFAAYPAVSRNILSTFACVQLGSDGHYLRADMRIECPTSTDFLTIWAAAFTCLISAGVPLILLMVMVVHGVPALARKKRLLSLLQGLVQSHERELSDAAAVQELLETLNRVDAIHKSENQTMSPAKWLELGQSTEPDDILCDEQAQVLAAVHKYTYPFTKETMTFEELICAIKAQQSALQYVPSKNFEASDDEAVVLALLAFAVRKLGEYNRVAAKQQRLLSLLSKDSKKKHKQHNSDEVNEEDTKQWMKIFDDHVIMFKPADSKDPACYPSTSQRLLMGSQKCKAFREEVTQQLYVVAERMHSAKLLSVQEASWDTSENAHKREKMVVLRLGFLFQSYRPSVWFFEVIEVFRKLIMASILIFVYEGTASQVVTGFMVTLVALLLSLWLRPFNDSSLQGMHSSSLFVQVCTLLAGVMIKADKFREILGVKGGTGMTVLGFLLVMEHVLVAVTPLLDMVYKAMYLKYVAIRRNAAADPSSHSCWAVESVEEGAASSDGVPPGPEQAVHSKVPAGVADPPQCGANDQVSSMDNTVECISTGSVLSLSAPFQVVTLQGIDLMKTTWDISHEGAGLPIPQHSKRPLAWYNSVTLPGIDLTKTTWDISHEGAGLPIPQHSNRPLFWNGCR